MVFLIIFSCKSDLRSNAKNPEYFRAPIGGSYFGVFKKKNLKHYFIKDEIFLFNKT